MSELLDRAFPNPELSDPEDRLAIDALLVARICVNGVVWPARDTIFRTRDLFGEDYGREYVTQSGG